MDETRQNARSRWLLLAEIVAVVVALLTSPSVFHVIGSRLFGH